MEAFYWWMIIILLFLILAKLNQGNKKPSKREIEKIKIQQKKNMEIVWWILAIIVILIMLRVICVIIASIKAPKGELFRYPLAIPFVQ